VLHFKDFYLHFLTKTNSKIKTLILSRATTKIYQLSSRYNCLTIKIEINYKSWIISSQNLDQSEKLQRFPFSQSLHKMGIQATDYLALNPQTEDENGRAGCPDWANFRPLGDC
jgi:hypothetical protein